MTAVLDVRDLVKTFALHGEGLFRRSQALVRAVDGVSFAIEAGETLGLVGESGSGKTTLARAAAGLSPPSAGTVLFDGRDVARLDRIGRKALRRHIQFVHQDPYGSLDPRLTVQAIVAEPLVIHGMGSAMQRHERVAQLLDAVGLGMAAAGRYPHEFSGGERQRIAIARALAPQPALLIADEPVSALDASVRSQILNLFVELRRTHGLTYLFIGHDLAVVRHVADRIAVMHRGRIVETAPTEELFEHPRHPYTRALLAAAPVFGRGKRTPPPGDAPPAAGHPGEGCPFTGHCAVTRAECFHTLPGPLPLADRPRHLVACHRRDEDDEGSGTP